MNETDFGTLLAIAGLTAISVVTRGFFFISEREWRLPGWAQRGLRYAPIAALAAVIAPDIVLTGGAVNDQVANVIIAQLLFLESENPEKDITMYINSPGGSIAAGMAVYLPLRLVWNW